MMTLQIGPFSVESYWLRPPPKKNTIIATINCSGVPLYVEQGEKWAARVHLSL